MVHSRVAKVLTFAPLAFALYVLSPWALYFTGWYDATLSSNLLHEVMHFHLVLIGALFFTPILGVDPVPGRVTYPFGMLLLVPDAALPRVPGRHDHGSGGADRRDWYPSLHASMPWLPDPAADQHLAGGILWASGDLIGLVLFGVLFVQWVRASTQEARREDRRLDRLERLAQSPDGPSPRAGSGDTRGRSDG